MRRLRRIVKYVYAVMFFLGCIISIAIACVLTIKNHNYATYGVDASAVIVECEESVWRGTTNIHLTYQYEVNRNQYTGTSISALGEYRACDSLPSNGQIDIIYLENEPNTSTIPSVSTSPIDSGTLAIMFVLSAVVNGIMSFRLAHSALTD